MPSQRPQHDTTPVVWNIRTFPNCQNQKCGHSGNSQLPPAKRSVSVPAGESDSAQEGSSAPSTIHGQNSTPLSSLNNARVEDITECMNFTLSSTEWHLIITPTATLGTSSRNTPAPSGTIQTDSTHHGVASPASSIANTRTPLSGLENLSTPIPNPEAHAIIANPLRTQANETNHSPRQWQFQPQAVSTPRSMVSDSHSIHRVGHSDMMHLVLQRADSWSSTCETDGGLWVQATCTW